MIYRKRGAAVRWENGELLQISECGIAEEREGAFFCRPDGQSRIEPPPSHQAESVAASILKLVREPVKVERLIVTEGVAEHEIGSRTWLERTSRIHLSLVRDTVRVALDASSVESSIGLVCDSLSRLTGKRTAVSQLRVAPHVTAALIPLMTAVPVKGARLIQTAGGIDGRALEIVEHRVEQQPWPNWYRPSYRARPVRAPLNVRLEPAGSIADQSLPLAVAVLAASPDLKVRLLVDDDLRSSIIEGRLAAVTFAGPPDVWFPHGAGVFGADAVIRIIEP